MSVDEWRKIVAQYSVDMLIERVKAVDQNDRGSELRLFHDIISAVGIRKANEFYAFLQLYVKQGDA